MRLQGKTALITGGTHGIGRAISQRFVSEGAKVAIAGNEEEALVKAQAELSKEGEVTGILTDVQDKSQVNSMVDELMENWGSIDILVHCAGICSPAPFLDIREEDWDRHLGVNLKGAFLVSQRIAREMVKQGNGGSIIHMSSVNGMAAEADQAHYNASKGGLNLLMMSMALELAPHQIRVNSLCPGFIETRLTQPLIRNPEAISEYLKSIPMGVVGQPDDLTGAALFLAGDDSKYMTGHCLVVDGGQLMKLS